MKAITALDFTMLPINIEWAVEKMVPAYGWNILVADSKVGKSILSMQLAHALGTGTSFLGAPVLKRKDGEPWKVLYIQGDEPPAEWKDQLIKVGLADGTWHTRWVPPGALTNPTEYNSIQQEAASYNFLILDAVTSLFDFMDIRSTTQAGIVVRAIRGLHTGPIWVLHHKRKPSPGAIEDVRHASAGNYAFISQASNVYDLTIGHLKGIGRLISIDMPLKRTKDGTGRWEKDQQAAVLW